MGSERTSVGLDVHARSVVACGLDGDTGELIRARLQPDPPVILAWLRSLPGPVSVVYVAGPTGFGLCRFLLAAGVPCVVAAPSKLQRPSGDRVKTDAKDALHLARLLRLGEIVAIAVPSVAQEAARDLVRAREDVRGDLMRPGTGRRSCCCARGSCGRVGPPGPARMRRGCAPRPSTTSGSPSPTTPPWRRCCSPRPAGTASTASESPSEQIRMDGTTSAT